MIKANVHSDDHVYTHDFDATPWFQQASDEELIELAKIDYGGDLAADQVALILEDQDAEIATLLEYCRKKDEVGFEVHINQSQAEAWLKENRPAVYRTVAH